MMSRVREWATARLSRLGRLRVIGRVVFLDLHWDWVGGWYGPGELIALVVRLLRPALRAVCDETGWGYRVRFRPETGGSPTVTDLQFALGDVAEKAGLTAEALGSLSAALRNWAAKAPAHLLTPRPVAEKS